MTVEQFQSEWKKMKETMSACKSGLHFGHLKLCSLHTFLSNFESCISHIPFATGYSPWVWKVGTMVMINTNAMVDLVTKLCTIVLTEADFNFNNKLFGQLKNNMEVVKIKLPLIKQCRKDCCTALWDWAAYQGHSALTMQNHDTTGSYTLFLCWLLDVLE